MDDPLKHRPDYTYAYYGFPVLDECPNYSINGIINYLQNEWNKIEIKSVQWEVERTELQAKIAYLQGERRSQENLKADLIRRIKMLEYALKQERKRQDILNIEKPDEQLGENVETAIVNHDDDETTIVSEFNESDIYLELSKNNQKINDENLKWRDEKLKLKKMFLESRDNGAIKSVVDNVDDRQIDENESEVSILKAKSIALTVDDDQSSSTSFIDGNFKFLSNENELFKNDKSGKAKMSEYDSETEDALLEFDCLVKKLQNKSDTNFGKEVSNDETEWAKVDQKAISKMKELYVQERGAGSKQLNGSNNDKMHLTQGSHDNSNSNNNDMIVYDDLVDGDISDSDKSSLSSASSGSSNSSILSVIGKKQLNNNKSINSSAATANLSLGELASLTNDTGLIIADPDQSVADASSNKTSLNTPIKSVSTNPMTIVGTTDTSLMKKTWSARFTMRSHFMGIRSVLFHPTQPLLITGSEDYTLKLWNLTKTIPSKKGSANLDVEPIYSYRGHTGPILCSCLDESMVISGGLDGEIRIWKIPASTMDPYDAFDTSLHVSSILKHEDAVWGVTLLKNKRLASISSDSVLKIWNLEPLYKATAPAATASTDDETKESIKEEDETEKESTEPDNHDISADSLLEFTHTLVSCSTVGRPSCIACVTCMNTTSMSLKTGCTNNTKNNGNLKHEADEADKMYLLVGFTDGLAGIFDINSGFFISKFIPQSTHTLDNSANTDSNTNINNVPVYAVVANNNKAHSLIGYEDGRIKCFDNSSCDIIFSILAHQNSVTSLDIDQHGTFLLSGSHDGKVRVWNLSNRSCLQEVTCHRVKLSEAIHSVVFHPTKNIFATAGADALAKVFI